MQAFRCLYVVEHEFLHDAARALARYHEADTLADEVARQLARTLVATIGKFENLPHAGVRDDGL